MIPFGFGLDQVTPSIFTKPGALREAQNGEIDINGAYAFSEGYERFSGQPRPSDATYTAIDVTISGSLTVGDTVTGATSSATGILIAINTTYDAAQAFIVLTKVVGTFVNAESLQVSAVTEATADSAPAPAGAPTIKLDAQYLNLAADEYRADIAAVPGSGSVLGVWMLDDIKYAWRNNVAGTAADLYKSTVAGWVNVPLGRELSFTSGGTTEVAEGDLLEGLISGATATITRVVLESGTWAAGTAAGRFIFASQTGTFQAEGVEVSSSGDLATIGGDSSAIALLPDGRYEFVNYNFGGSVDTKRAYGVDKVNRGFEFDGIVFAPIETGMTTDVPTHVGEFENHLFFSYSGSAQHSGIGEPFTWTVILGAAELAIGDTVTAFKTLPGREGNGSLAIFAENRISMLYGTSSADWNLAEFRTEVGAAEYTVQELGITLSLDDRGFSKLSTVQNYGNFGHDTISELIQPWINERKNKATASCISRDKSQYRCFFSDDLAMYITTKKNKIVGMIPQQLNHTVKCMFSLETSAGTEEMMFGSDDGFVYQLDKGTSFDGEDIERILILHFHHGKSPRVIKKYLYASMEIQGNGYSEFNFTFELDYNKDERPQPGQETLVANFSDTRWDSFTWDAFFWDGKVLSPSTAELAGSAENISLIIRSKSDYFQPLKFSSAQLFQTIRRQMRKGT